MKLIPGRYYILRNIFLSTRLKGREFIVGKYIESIGTKPRHLFRIRELSGYLHNGNGHCKEIFYDKDGWYFSNEDIKEIINGKTEEEIKIGIFLYML